MFIYRMTVWKRAILDGRWLCSTWSIRTLGSDPTVVSPLEISQLYSLRHISSSSRKEALTQHLEALMPFLDLHSPLAPLPSGVSSWGVLCPHKTRREGA